jgi:iron-sulfur cluster assembly protein
MFTLTHSAAKQVQQSAKDRGAQDMALRIAAKIDVEGAMQYGMGFDDPTDEDMKLELDGVAVVIVDQSKALLFDTILDYVEMEPGEFNFIFIVGSQSPCASEQFPAGGGCSNGGCSGGGCASKGKMH